MNREYQFLSYMNERWQRRMLSRILATGVIVLSLVALARSQTPGPTPDRDNWTYLTASLDDNEKVLTGYWYRKDSVVRISDSVIKFWIRQQDFERTWSPDYKLTLFNLDCRLHQFQLRQEITEIKGKRDSWAVDKGAMIDIPPDSIVEALSQKMCLIGLPVKNTIIDEL